MPNDNRRHANTQSMHVRPYTHTSTILMLYLHLRSFFLNSSSYWGVLRYRPNDYSDNEYCHISVRPGAWITMEDFTTEACCDTLNVNDKYYSGTDAKGLHHTQLDDGQITYVAHARSPSPPPSLPHPPRLSYMRMFVNTR